MAGHEAMVKVLIEHGANVAATTEHGGKAADFATTFGHTSIASLLTMQR